ncbi:carboxylesterase family protein [Nonomuraea sp. NPDC005983]|uniref:carboxylesterase/lipase family protein n=1 Tax=Nonomuraea sp. NPDC005983 TaxID=3155595 RepID=UPI0033BE068C
MHPRVHTQQGDVEGRQQEGIFWFLGLPFARPPVGDLRWRPPAPPERWDGVRPATRFGPACPQFIPAMFNLRTQDKSEDCLYLNIWTPELGGQGRQPVMVWIHGGGYLYGAGSEDGFDGARLASRGVTVVTVNYRLGAFGLAAHPAIGANFAILDHIAALTWVADNIQAFGGDPGNVTVFGQSAGAVSVRSLLAAPKARGLFHRAIMQSGGGEPIAAAPNPPAAPARAVTATAELFDRLGGADLSVLRHVPTAQIAALSHELSGAVPPAGQVHTPANLVWTPLPDNDVLSATGFPGAPTELPILLGHVTNEARYFIKPTGTYPDAIIERMARALAGAEADDVLAELRSHQLTSYEALDLLFTTAIFVEPAYAALQRSSLLGHPAYYYRFDRVSPGGRRTGELAKHTCDIRYVFGNLDPADDYDQIDRGVSDAMQSAWVEFARTGVPASGSAWPRFDPAAPKLSVIADAVRLRPLVTAKLTEIIAAQR